ncbi:ATP-dependent protease Clp, ATPase subunit [Candidatus Scalindua japonica]|uniref:ATP-dependent protease Clp, ATPase subunit n=1 Tax=Candidatus Scalindua japonica TaxID=1284222 RepID=A0A286TUC0_9BACT|nr:GspMb/PilO family protein [Candidatus Scalindua japonica]GAX59476.1 ATP-dependent protease Clp, ATPase subunit [Candidatus Scalindua japonica]
MRTSLNKLSKRTVVFLSITVVLIIIIICDQLSFNPFQSKPGSLNDKIALKKELFIKYNAVISDKDLYEKQLMKLKNTYSSFETKFIRSTTEDLAQAKLQDYIKSVARKSGLMISRSSAQKVEIINEKPHLMLVYARVQINEIDKIKRLQKFLHNIEYNNEKLVFVDDLKIKSTGFTTTKGVSATIKLFAIAMLETKVLKNTAGLPPAIGITGG